MAAVTRSANSLAKELTDAVAKRVKGRFDAVKAIAKAYEKALENAATPSSSQLQPCCKQGKCTTCRVRTYLSAKIAIDPELSCLQYPGTVSAAIPNGNNVPARETAALVGVQPEFKKLFEQDST